MKSWHPIGEYMVHEDGDYHKMDTADAVYFYEQDFYVLSNFSAFQVGMNGLWHQTAEHLYHYLKFVPELECEDPGKHGRIMGTRHRIFTAKSAHEAFQIAQKEKELRRPDWDTLKLRYMKEILFLKTSQHDYVRKKLLQTGNRLLVEDSWRDDYWGWGPRKDGRNMLGNLWMEIREDLRNGKITW